MLALFSALDQIADADIELRLILEIVGAELARAEQRKELRVPRKIWIWPQVCGHFFSLVLQNRRACGLHRVVVLQRQPNRLIESDLRGRIRARRRGYSGRRRWRQRRHFLPLAGGQRGQNQKHGGPRQSFPHGENLVSREETNQNGRMELQRKEGKRELQEGGRRAW